MESVIIIPVKTFKEETAPTPQKFLQCIEKRSKTPSNSFLEVSTTPHQILAHLHEKGKLKAIYLMNPKQNRRKSNSLILQRSNPLWSSWVHSRNARLAQYLKINAIHISRTEKKLHDNLNGPFFRKNDYENSTSRESSTMTFPICSTVKNILPYLFALLIYLVM